MHLAWNLAKKGLANEDYESPQGYWLEDDVDTGEVDSISIFIHKVLDEDNFDYCTW